MPPDVLRVARAMLSDLPALMSEATDRVWMQVPMYSDVLLERTELGDRVEENLGNVISCLLEDREPSSFELERSAQNGQRRALQGVSHAALVQSFRNAERILTEAFAIWSAKMQVKPANARLGSRAMIGYLDQLEHAMVQAFIEMQEKITTRTVLTEPDLVNRLVAGQPIAPVELETLASALALHDISTTRFIGVCAIPTEVVSARELAQVRHHIVAELHAVTKKPVLSGTVLTDQGLHAAVFTLPWEGDVSSLAATLTATLSQRKIGVSVLAAVGEPRYGLSLAGESCRQAIAALSVGRALDKERTAIIYSDVLLEVLAMRDSVVVRQLYERYVGPLASHDLLEETLRCFLETNQSIAETALLLRIHKNTVTYRIRRIEDLTGLDLRLARDVARAVIAFEGVALGTVVPGGASTKNGASGPR